MLSTLFSGLNWTRDDLKWTVGIIAAIVIALATLGNTITDYGLPATWLPYLRLGAFVIGVVSAKMATSGLPGARFILIGLLTVGTAIGVSACHPPSSVVTPQGQRAWSADQFVQRLGELESAAIQANKTGGLKDAPAVRVVQFCVDSAKAAKSAPAGWMVSVSAGWSAVKHDVPELTSPQLATYTGFIDALIASYGG